MITKSYKFLEANYTMPFLDAFNEALVEEKLVHMIVLWGRLDDQAC